MTKRYALRSSDQAIEDAEINLTEAQIGTKFLTWGGDDSLEKQMDVDDDGNEVQVICEELGPVWEVNILYHDSKEWVFDSCRAYRDTEQSATAALLNDYFCDVKGDPEWCLYTMDEYKKMFAERNSI